MDVNRRGFLKGAALAGVATVSAGLLGCTANNSPADNSPNETTSQVSHDTVATYDCEILIVGSGMSGLAAAVQAGQNGSKTILIESTQTTGGLSGLGVGVEGIFAVGTPVQEQMNIQIDPGDVLYSELESSGWRANGLLWADLINNSAENYDWLEEQGCKFSGDVDDYHGGDLETFHWFINNGEGSRNLASYGYVPFMTERATELGVEIMTETRGAELISKEGKIVGLYAQDSSDNYIQINAPTVILATGGFAGSAEILSTLGYNVENIEFYSGVDIYNRGDGFKMAMSVGAKDVSSDTCYLNGLRVRSGGDFEAGFALGGLISPLSLWVNGECERFVSEYRTGKSDTAAIIPTFQQEITYSVLGQNFVDTLNEEGKVAFDELIKNCPYNNVYKADSIAELATLAGLDANTLAATVDRYNTLCAEGRDRDFGKPAEYMMPIEAPFYIVRLDHMAMAAIGGINTNRDFEVCTSENEPIPGLYAIGLDGARLWRNVYTINIPGTANANNINSGRVAANNAAKYLNG